jgi:hypothetical protein
MIIGFCQGSVRALVDFFIRDSHLLFPNPNSRPACSAGVLPFSAHVWFYEVVVNSKIIYYHALILFQSSHHDRVDGIR